MKIGNSSEVAAASATAAIEKSGNATKQKASQQSQATRAAGHTAEPDSGTQLELSSTATQLLQGAGGQSESFDAAKVQRITQAISEGKFSVNAEAVADKLLSNAQEVLSSRDDH